jgi:hypothetical protein
MTDYSSPPFPIPGGNDGTDERSRGLGRLVGEVVAAQPRPDGQDMRRLGSDDNICPGCTQLRKDCQAWERLCTRAVYVVIGMSSAAAAYAAWCWFGAGRWR